MKSIIDLLAKLYPRWWRDRYGAEFQALLDDDSATLRTAFNVFSGALFMRIRTLLAGNLLDYTPMMELLRRNRWLLVFSGILQAAIAAVYLMMYSSSGPITAYKWSSAIALLGFLEIGAGFTAAAASLIRSKNGKSGLLLLNGLGFVALGIIHTALMHRPVRFTAIAALVIIMSLSIGMLALQMARISAAVIAALFIAVFAALSLRWIPIEPGSLVTLLWLGCYFAFSALSFFGGAGFSRRSTSVLRR